MHRQIGGPLLQRDFELFDKQALAAHLAQGPVQDLIALGGHAQQLDRMALLTQQGLNVFGLPEGEAAFTGGDGQVHDVQPGKTGEDESGAHPSTMSVKGGPKIGG